MNNKKEKLHEEKVKKYTSNYIHQKVVSYFKTNMTSCEGICKDLAIHLKKTMAKHKVHMVDMYIKIMPVLPLIDNQPPVNRAFMEYSESGRFI